MTTSLLLLYLQAYLPYSERMHSLFGKRTPTSSEIKRKTVGILVTEDSQQWLDATSKRFGISLGSLVGLLVEAAKEDSAVFESALFGKHAEDFRSKKRKEIIPGSVQKDCAISILMSLAEDYEKDQDRPTAQNNDSVLSAVIVKILNPGNFLDREVADAVERLRRDFHVDVDAEKEIDSAYEERHRIISQWGDTAINFLTSIDNMTRRLAAAKKPRLKRSYTRRIATAEKEFSEFCQKIRARDRGSNIPTTLEEAERMQKRREGREGRALIVLEGKQAS